MRKNNRPMGVLKHQPAWNSQEEASYFHAHLTKAQLYALYRDLLAQTTGRDWTDLSMAEITADVNYRSQVLANYNIYPKH